VNMANENTFTSSRPGGAKTLVPFWNPCIQGHR
jgi:hypothetical protein